MTWWIVGGVAVVLLVALLVLVFGNRYAPLFADWHVQQACEVLDDIRQAACARIEDSSALDAGRQSAESILTDPRNGQTERGMRFSYTAARDAEHPGQVRHSLSMSHEKAYPAETLPRFFVALAILRYGLRVEDVAIARTASYVTHAVWVIEDDDHAAYAARREPILEMEELLAFRRQVQELGQSLRFQRISVPNAS